MTNTDLVRAEDDRRWNNLQRRAAMLCRTKLVPKELQGNEAATHAALVVLEDYGLPANPQTLKQLHFPGSGAPDLSAQLLSGLATGHGYELEWGRNDDETAEVRIKHRTSDRWQGPFVYTIAQARTSGALDRWVEQRVRDGNWPDGNARYRVEKFVLGQEGVDVPDWVTAEVRAGRTKQSENWHRYPGDMLAARAIKRAIRRAAPHLILGIPIDTAAGAAAPGQPPAPQPQPTGDPDEDVVDAELVDEPHPHPPVDEPAHPTPVSDDWVRRFATAARENTPDGVDPDQLRHAIVWTATNGRTESSKDVLVGDEANAVATWTNHLLHQKARIERRPDNADGLHLVMYEPGEEPFE